MKHVLDFLAPSEAKQKHFVEINYLNAYNVGKFYAEKSAIEESTFSDKLNSKDFIAYILKKIPNISSHRTTILDSLTCKLFLS